MEIAGVDVTTLDPKSIGAWPRPIQIGVLVAAFILTMVLGFMFDISPQMSEIKTEGDNEKMLRAELSEKYQKAVNLDAYKEQLKVVQASLEQALRQLPSQNEVAALLEEISQKAAANGLEYRSIKPLSEVQHGFYVELPIELSIVGDYHSFGRFISQLSSLSRIVTLHDFAIKSEASGDKPKADQLLFNVVAKTYWYTAEKGG